MHLVR